ncbi:MAG: hypothetical protein PHH85_12280 [Candidatus Methanoperedens sp.]|nr:hypothetical protein [Candidatus Methanoperedens sp.]
MSNRNRSTMKTVLLVTAIFAIISSAAAQVEITDFFSDFTSSDVTLNSTSDFQGKAIFELFYAGALVESHDVPIDIKAGGTTTKVILWEKNPQQDYYTAKVSIHEGTTILSSKSFQVSYGTVSMPGFHVVDFSPTNNGVKLLLRPFNPSSVDVKIELLDNNDIVYTKVKDNIYLTVNQEVSLTWPFLLKGKKEYTVRAKIYTHRLYAGPLINTYISHFIAADDVEILHDDVEVDEYGASVTLLGNSQVPFDGAIVVNAKNKITGETKTYRQALEEILVSGKEDTAGVVWKGIAPGTYDVEILAVNKENMTIDKYETVMRIPEPPAVATTPVNRSPGFAALVSMIVLIAAARLLKGG